MHSATLLQHSIATEPTGTQHAGQWGPFSAVSEKSMLYQTPTVNDKYLKQAIFKFVRHGRTPFKQKQVQHLSHQNSPALIAVSYATSEPECPAQRQGRPAAPASFSSPIEKTNLVKSRLLLKQNCNRRIRIGFSSTASNRPKTESMTPSIRQKPYLAARCRSDPGAPSPSSPRALAASLSLLPMLACQCTAAVFAFEVPWTRILRYFEGK